MLQIAANTFNRSIALFRQEVNLNTIPTEVFLPKNMQYPPKNLSSYVIVVFNGVINSGHFDIIITAD